MTLYQAFPLRHRDEGRFLDTLLPVSAIELDVGHVYYKRKLGPRRVRVPSSGRTLGLLFVRSKPTHFHLSWRTVAGKSP